MLFSASGKCGQEQTRLSLTVCNRLIDKLPKRFCLLFAGYGANDRLTYNIAVLIDNIGCGECIQSRGKRSCLTL